MVLRLLAFGLGCRLGGVVVGGSLSLLGAAASFCLWSGFVAVVGLWLRGFGRIIFIGSFFVGFIAGSSVAACLGCSFAFFLFSLVLGFSLWRGGFGASALLRVVFGAVLRLNNGLLV